MTSLGPRFRGTTGEKDIGAQYEVRGDVAVITLDNPPVNGLGYTVRRAVAEGFDRARDDAAVRAIVVTGAGKAFSAGGDLVVAIRARTVGEKVTLTIRRSGSERDVTMVLEGSAE